jgi:hypothetical protein
MILPSAKKRNAHSPKATRVIARSAELEALHRISLRLNAKLDTDNLHRFIVEQATALLAWRHSVLSR